MAETHRQRKVGPAERDRNRLLLDVAREEAREAVRISEILDSKMRSIPQIASVFFAAGQVAVASILTQPSGVPGLVVIFTAALGALALISVGTCLIGTIRSQGTSPQGAIEISKIRDHLERQEGDGTPVRLLLATYTRVVDRRRKSNKKKAEKLSWIQWAGGTAVVVTAAQLLLAIVAFYLGDPGS